MVSTWWRETLTAIAVVGTVGLAARGGLLRIQVQAEREGVAETVRLRLDLQDARRSGDAQAVPATVASVASSASVSPEVRAAAVAAGASPTPEALETLDRALRAESTQRSERLGVLWQSVDRILSGTIVAALASLLTLQRAWANRRRMLAERARLDAEVASRTAAEAARDAERTLLAAVLSHAPVGVVLARPDGTPFHINPAAAGLLDTACPVDVRGSILTRAAHRAPTGPERWTGRGPDGVERTLEFECYPVGVPTVALVMLARDLSAQERMRARLQAAEGLALTGTLAAGVAHELNNPLTAALGVATELRAAFSEGESTAPDGMEELVDDLDRSLSRIRQVAHQVTALARPPQESDLFDPSRPVAQAIRRALPELLSRGAVVQADLPPAPALRGDPQRLLHITTGLLANAAAALRPGGGEVRVTVVPNPAGEVVLTVEDDGVGMGPELQARAFEPFFTTRPGGEGMGLGLFQVRAFAESMNGRVRLQSAPGRGTRVEVTLPPGAPPASAGPAGPLQ